MRFFRFLLAAHVGRRAKEAFADLAADAFAVKWGDEDDTEANRICRRHKALGLGLVDAVVMSVAERLQPTDKAPKQCTMDQVEKSSRASPLKLLVALPGE